MHWCLILEEYGPELHYLKGEKNIVADALSRLTIQSTPTPTIDLNHIAEVYGQNTKELPDDAVPITFKEIQ